MKKAPILLGFQRKIRSSPDDGNLANTADLDEDDWDMQYDLRKPEHIIIADDTNAYQVFGDSIFAAPQEDILEGRSVIVMYFYLSYRANDVGFYKGLGSRQLSSLVKEDYKTSVELRESKTAAETRSLILERLPLFLHEHTHARTRVSFAWLNSGNNFVVKTFGKLSVTKTLNYGDIRLSKIQDASAVAKRIGYGPIQLWIAGNAQLDMYE